MSITADQYRDIYKWLSRQMESGFPLIHEMAKFLWSFDTDQTTAKITDEIVTTMLLGNDLASPALIGADFLAMPSINTTPINRLRVLADEIQKVAGQLYLDSLPRNQDIFDTAADIRASIGVMIAFAALNTPIRSNP